MNAVTGTLSCDNSNRHDDIGLIRPIKYVECRGLSWTSKLAARNVQYNGGGCLCQTSAKGRGPAVGTRHLVDDAAEAGASVLGRFAIERSFHAALVAAAEERPEFWPQATKSVVAKHMLTGAASAEQARTF